MRLVNLKDLKGGEISACDIIDVCGRVLLAKDSHIKLSYLNKLSSQGISEIYIEDKISEGIIVEDILCQKTKQEAREKVEKEISKFMKKKQIDIEALKKVSNMIINEILLNKAELINLKDLRLKGEYLFSHSINVCAMSSFLALKLGMEEEKIYNIGVGALLHDFGKILIPNEILEKPGPLTKEEFAEVKLHPIVGYEAFKNDPNISPTTKMVIYMHHERVDGNGYPNKFSGNKIIDAAKICCICNAVDAMSSDRPFRAAYNTTHIISELINKAGTYYDEHFVDMFLKYIPVFPAGSIVLLSNDIIAIVVKNNSKNFLRPVVRLIYNRKSGIKYRNFEIDLSQEMKISIIGEIPIDLQANKL